MSMNSYKEYLLNKFKVNLRVMQTNCTRGRDYAKMHNDFYVMIKSKDKSFWDAFYKEGNRIVELKNNLIKVKYMPTGEICAISLEDFKFYKRKSDICTLVNKSNSRKECLVCN